MPHVAFDPNTQAAKALHAANARSSQPADRGTPSSFDSLIDDSLPEAPRASARDDNAPRADRPEPTQSRSADRPNRSARSDDRSRSADAASDAPDKADATAAKDTTGADQAQESQKSKESSSDDTKADGDTETTAAEAVKNAATDNAGKAADAAAVATAIAAQTPAAVTLAVTDAAASAEAAQPAADDGAIATGDAQKAQLAALAALQAQAGGKVDGKSKDAAALKSDPKSDKAEAKAEGKAEAGKAVQLTPAELEAAAKAQGAGEADTDSGAHAQAKTVTEAHRGATTNAQAKTASDDTIATPKVTADIMQPTLPQAPAQPAQAQTVIAAAAAPASAQASQEPAVPLNGVGIEIASKALSGKNQFDIRLDPPELGRIHVRLDVDHKGNVITHMVADRTDTLDMLRRDSASLERALQDAGLKTSDNGMQFSLRDQSADQRQSGGERGANAAHIVVEDDSIPAAIARDYGRMGARAGGLDIKV